MSRIKYGVAGINVVIFRRSLKVEIGLDMLQHRELASILGEWGSLQQRDDNFALLLLREELFVAFLGVRGAVP
jgi:hypothetical protein